MVVMLFACGPVAQPAEAPAADATDPPAPAAAAGVSTAQPSASAQPLEAASHADSAAPASAPRERSALVGTISSATIFDIVMKHQDLFNECYTIGAGKSEQLIATVTVKALVGPTGVVNDVSVLKSTAKNAKLDECVLGAFRKMSFPATGSTVPITFPMKFDGVEQVP
jgi:TonB family protein